MRAERKFMEEKLRRTDMNGSRNPPLRLRTTLVNATPLNQLTRQQDNRQRIAHSARGGREEVDNGDDRNLETYLMPLQCVLPRERLPAAPVAEERFLACVGVAMPLQVVLAVE